MTLESVIEGITKRCKEAYSELQDWLEKRDERKERLERAKRELAEAVKKGIPEDIKFWKQSVKNWKGHIQYASDVIKTCEAKQTELFLLCDEVGLKYWDIVLDIGGAQ